MHFFHDHRHARRAAHLVAPDVRRCALMLPDERRSNRRTNRRRNAGHGIPQPDEPERRRRHSLIAELQLLVDTTRRRPPSRMAFSKARREL
jgi:hypothetical protein